MLHSEVRSAAENIQICPITSGDVERVAAFLHAELNGRLSPSAWAAAIRPTWPSASPNHGFMLVNGERVLGAYVAFYSQRRVDDRLAGRLGDGQQRREDGGQRSEIGGTRHRFLTAVHRCLIFVL